jgi:hypothetical protein
MIMGRKFRIQRKRRPAASKPKLVPVVMPAARLWWIEQDGDDEAATSDTGYAPPQARQADRGRQRPVQHARNVATRGVCIETFRSESRSK